jgi:predicted ATPase
MCCRTFYNNLLYTWEDGIIRMEKEQKRYVLTGGPGSGKSAIILALEFMGNYVVREAAEDYIKLRMAHGQKEPWDEPDFQERIFQLQQQREQQIDPNARIVFIDRGLPDGFAYALPGSNFGVRVVFSTFRQQYEKIFKIEQLKKFERGSFRKETTEEAHVLGEKLFRIYRELGYPVIRIADAPLDQRVKEILKHVNGVAQGQNHKN